MTERDRERAFALDDDPDGTPTAEELLEAERLRSALDGQRAEGEPSPAGAELARAIVAAVRPEPIDLARSEALLERALARRGERRRGNVLYVAFGAAALVASAAAAVLAVRGFGEDARGRELPELATSRSADDLFGAAFPKTGGTSARVDRIAMARRKDYRANQFARWGVR